MNPLKKYEDKFPVNLNIYDMTSMNHYSEKLGLGVYHSGLEIFGLEYSYGGHPHNETGIFTVEPKGAVNFQKRFQYKETVFMGYTNHNETELTQILHSMGSNRFRGKKYHLFFNNCNHFTHDLAMLLCIMPIPGWVNRLARIGSNIPFLDAILPQEILMPTITMAPNDTYENNRKQHLNYIV